MTNEKNKHAVALGKLGRGRTSERKAAAARLNGKRGGRPRRQMRQDVGGGKREKGGGPANR